MKTSNKILLFIGAAFLISPFINAYSIKSKLKNKDYTLMTSMSVNSPNSNIDNYDLVPITPTDSIHIIGGNNIDVNISYSDTASIQQTADSSIRTSVINGVLTIEFINDKHRNKRDNGRIIIKTPSLKSVSLSGEKSTTVTEVRGSKTTNVVHQPFSVSVHGFKNDDLLIHSIEGSGHIILENNDIKKVLIKSDENARIMVVNNIIGILDLEAKAVSDITIEGGQIKTLHTDLSPRSRLSIVGTNVKGTIYSSANQ